MKRILLAGGGTGGHVFPMIAVADALRALAPDVELVFVGTARGLETKAVPARGYRLELLHVLPMRGDGLRGFVRGAARAALSLPEARTLVTSLSPGAVFSIGGYAAGPVSVAARSLSIPLALMEPNSAIGLANRLVAPLVQRAYLAFPESARHFPKNSVLHTGVPIRGGFSPRALPSATSGGALRVLVLGGSQGAQSLNETVPRALAALGGDVRVVHQCGAGRDGAVRDLYASLGAAGVATVVPFIDDMPDALAAADLVIGRAGAGAVAEICAVGRPSLLIPYPFAGDHQRHNADALVREGAALCILAKDATVERLTREVSRLAGDRAALATMAESARKLGRPDAATVIARDLLRLAGIGGSGSNGAAAGTGGQMVPHGGGMLAASQRILAWQATADTCLASNCRYLLGKQLPTLAWQASGSIRSERTHRPTGHHPLSARSPLGTWGGEHAIWGWSAGEAGRVGGSPRITICNCCVSGGSRV